MFILNRCRCSHGKKSTVGRKVEHHRYPRISVNVNVTEGLHLICATTLHRVRLNSVQVLG